MRPPAALMGEIRLFLEETLGAENEDQRRFLVTTAELDEMLHGRLKYGGGTHEFCDALLLAVTREDLSWQGRDPLLEVLKAAQKIVGPARRHLGDALLARLRQDYSSSEGEEPPRRNLPPTAMKRPRSWSQREILRHLRGQELERIQVEFALISRNDRPRICFLHGKSGAGKTAMLDIAATELLRAKCPPRWLRLFVKAPRHVAVPQEKMVLPLLEQVRDACERSGLKAYLRDFDRQLVEGRKSLRAVLEERLDRISPQPDFDLRENLIKLIGLGGLVAFNLLTSQSCTPTPDDVQVLVRLVGSKIEVIHGCFDWWRCHLPGDKELASLSSLRKGLAPLLGAALKKCSQEKDFLVVSIDGYDSPTTEDLVDLVRCAGAKVFWIIAGRVHGPLNPIFARMLDSSCAHLTIIPLHLLERHEILEILVHARQNGSEGSVIHGELESVAERIHRLTRGVLPYVEMALQTWSTGRNVEDHLGQVFWQHLQQNLDTRHRFLVYSFLLTEFESYQDRLAILKHLTDQEGLERLVRDLSEQCPVVTESPADLMKLDSHFSEIVRSYLTSQAVRGKSEIQRIHIKAGAYLAKKKLERESRLSPGKPRFCDERWQEIELARCYHRLHLVPDHAWPELASVLVGTLLYRQFDFHFRLLEMLQSLHILFEGANARRLDRFESGLSEQAGKEERCRLIDELGELLDEGSEGADGATTRDLLQRLRREVEASESVAVGPAELLEVLGPESELVQEAPVEALPNDDRAGVIMASYRQAGELLDQGEPLAALETLQSAGADAIDPNSGEFLGRCYIELQRFDEAILAYRAAAEQSIPSRIRLGDLYLKVERWSDAKEMYLWALRSDPRQPAGLVGAAESLLQLGLFQEAREYFRQACASLPGELGPLMGFLHTGRKISDLEGDPMEGAGTPCNHEDLERVHRAEAFLESEEVRPYDRACFTALLGKPERALRYLVQAMRHDPSCRVQAAVDPYLEQVVRLPGYHGMLQALEGREGGARPRRQPVYLLLGCHSHNSELLASPESGLAVLCREILRKTLLAEACWLSVITFDREARQTVPLNSVYEIQLRGLKPDYDLPELTALGGAFKILGDSLQGELTPASSDCPEGDHAAWAIVIIDREPEAEWRSALSAVHAAGKSRLERVIVLGLGEVNYSTLREIAPASPHQVQQMPDVTPARLSDFFRWLCTELVACLGPGQPPQVRDR